MSARRRRVGTSPFIAAGLVRFTEAKEIERIRVNPYVVLLLGLGFSILILLLRLLMPI